MAIENPYLVCRVTDLDVARRLMNGARKIIPQHHINPKISHGVIGFAIRLSKTVGYYSCFCITSTPVMEHVLSTGRYIEVPLEKLLEVLRV